MRAALYPRVSTEEQRRCGLSIGAQIESLTQYAKSAGHTTIESVAAPVQEQSEQ